MKFRTLLHALGAGLALSSPSLVDAAGGVNLPLPPPAPTDTRECSAYADRINAVIADIYRQRKDAPTRHPPSWVHYPVPNCPNPTSYGPREWAPYEDAICMANKARHEGSAECMRLVAQHQTAQAKQPVPSSAEINLYQRGAGFYAKDGARSVADTMLEHHQDLYPATYKVNRLAGQLEYANSVIAFFSNSTSKAEKAELMPGILSTAGQEMFRGNSIAALMSSVATALVLDHYKRSAAELTTLLEEFDSSAYVIPANVSRYALAPPQSSSGGGSGESGRVPGLDLSRELDWLAGETGARSARKDTSVAGLARNLEKDVDSWETKETTARLAAAEQQRLATERQRQYDARAAADRAQRDREAAQLAQQRAQREYENAARRATTAPSRPASSSSGNSFWGGVAAGVLGAANEYARQQSGSRPSSTTCPKCANSKNADCKC